LLGATIATCLPPVDPEVKLQEPAYVASARVGGFSNYQQSLFKLEYSRAQYSNQQNVFIIILYITIFVE
jgi:hypothetical protein